MPRKFSWHPRSPHHPSSVPAAKAFLSAISKITGTGNFHAAGTAPFFLPGLHLEGLTAHLPVEAYWIVDVEWWQKLHQAFGSDTFEPIYQSLLRESANLARRPLFQVLASLATRSDGVARAQAIATQLALLGPAKPASAYGGNSPEPPPVGDREEVRVLLAASHHLENAKDRKAVCGFLEADASVPYVRGILGPALLEISSVAALKRTNSLAPSLLAFVISILETEMARPLPPYPDWTRPCPKPAAQEPNPCRLYRSPAAKRPDPLRELADFMADPKAREHHFARPEAERSNLEHFINRHFLDVDFTTIRKGSPHTLACTKNDKSHHRALALREADRILLGRLAKLRR